MNPNQIIEDAKTKFNAAATHLTDELKKLRTGRASAAMLDGVMVTAYGAQMPLNQVANVTAPEAQLIQVTPFDPSNIQAISAAIRENQTLGFNPIDDGRVVRVPVPQLTEERRRDIVKVLNGKVEETLVTMRSARHDALRAIDQGKKDKEYGEDEAKRLTKQIDDELSLARSKAEQAAKAKEQEIMTL